jgi:hypothetical protein
VHGRPDERPEPTVIFLHIGKTAGTTLGRILRRHYPRREVYGFKMPRDPRDIPDGGGQAGAARLHPPREQTLATFARLPEAERASYRLILGHTVFGIHELVPRHAVYITILRHPVALVPSLYSYVKRTPTHRHHRAVMDVGMSLEEYVGSDFALEADNSQARAISGDLSTPIGACGPEMLASAKRNLEEWFPVVGVTERFDESLIALRRAFGWSRLHYVRAKTAPRRERTQAVSPRAADLIRERNALDIALWEHASAGLDALIGGDDAQQALARFRRENALYRPIGTLSYTVPKAVHTRFFRKRS